MYLGLIVLQIISCILCTACVYIIFIQRDNKLSKYMLMVVIFGLIQNYGYLLEMLSKTKDEAMAAVKFEYIGGAFTTLFFFLFVCLYCEYEIPKWYRTFRLILGICVLLGVWHSNYVTIYYSSISFTESGVFPHLVLGHGFLYVLSMLFAIGDIISAFALSVFSLSKSRDTKQESVTRMISVTCFIIVILFILDMTCMNTLLQGYDILPVSIMIAIVLFGIAVIFSNFFDVAGLAREEIVRKGMREAVVIVDKDYKLEEANEQAIKLFPTLIDIKAGTNIPFDVMRIFNRDGERDFYIGNRYYDIHVSPIFHSSKILGHTATLFDVTERKYQLEKMKSLKLQADAANDAKSAFLANISHEIRTPINAIIGVDEMILRDYEEPQILEYAESIKAASHSMLELVSNILDISKIEAGKMKLVEKDYNVKKFFDELISLYSPQCNQKGLEMVSKISPDIPEFLCGDTSRIRQVLSNFISNAIKYTPSGTVTVRAFYDNALDNSGCLIISVEDTGIGIKKEDQNKLFESFVRVDEEKNSGIQGTGLGLNIARNLVELMDGDIKIDSEYGRGSVFTVIIPQSIGTGQKAEDDKNGTYDDTVSGNSEIRAINYIAPNASILVVDDSATNQMVAKSLLKYIEADVACVSSGEECLEAIERKRYDIIFMDHKMPGMDGEATFIQMKNMEHMCKDTPVIMLTANAGSDLEEFFKSKGFADLLSKPITAVSITNMVRKHLPDELIDEMTSKNIWKR